MNPLTILGVAVPPWVKLALKLAPYVVIALLLASLIITRGTLARSRLEAAAALDHLAEGVRVNTAIAEVVDQQHARTVEQLQSKVTSNVSANYEKRLADLRARFSRLPRAPAADSGGGKGAGLPSVSNAASGSHGATPEDGLPPADVLTASEQALQLDGLQEWVRQQQAVPR